MAGPAPGAAATTLAERLRVQSRECSRLGSELYAGLLARAAEDVEVGGPVRDLLDGHQDDPACSALALRLMGAVHRLVLEGELPDLAGRYGDSQADPIATWRAFSAALATQAEALRRLIERPVQTNEVGRCAALLPGFLAVAESTGLPLRLLELGSSAGLNLRWDRYRYEAAGFGFGPTDSPLTIAFGLAGEPPPASAAAIVERRGCDPSPIDPVSEQGRLTLLSYVWAGQPVRAARTRAALELAASAPAPIDPASATEWLPGRLVEEKRGIATVVFHSIVMQYLPEEEREAIAALIRDAGDRAGELAPLAWLRMEPAGKRADIRLTIWPGGEERRIARAGYHGDPVELL